MPEGEENIEEVNQGNVANEGEKLAFNLVGLACIEGLGFASAAELHVLLGVNTVHDLYSACKEGRLVALDGWGETRQKKLMRSIELSVLWFRSHCKKVERENEATVIENMARAVGIDSDLMKEIAEAHAEINKEENGDD